MSDTTNQPAFPVQDASTWQAHGMTLRDYFAAKAMQGYVLTDALVNDTDTQQAWIDLTAKTSYQMADAMIKARGAK